MSTQEHCRCGRASCPGGGFTDEQHCYWHGYEPMPLTKPFRVCLECGHVYRTEEDLFLAHLEVVNRLEESSLTLDQTEDRHPYWANFCALCVHDF